MDNKDRDMMSRKTTPTSAGNVNRSTSERMSQEKGDNAAEFGNKIGRSEDMMHEPSRREDSTSGSSSSTSSGSSGSRSSSSGSDWQSSGSDRSSGSSSGYNDSDKTGSKPEGNDRDKTGSNSGRH